MNSDNRYIRQILLDKIGLEGQEKLNLASVAVVGCGGLGSLVAPYLAGAGVSRLILCDGDNPDITNVHRQVFYSGNEKESKAISLAKHIVKINPDVECITVGMLSKENISETLKNIDLVLECTDNMLTKYLVNDFCFLKRIPMIYGALYKYDGYVSLFPNQSQSDIHLRDIFPEPDLTVPRCSEVGVLPTLAGIIAMLQANEAIKYLTQIGRSLSGSLLHYNALENEQLKIKLKKSYFEDLELNYEANSYLTSNCTIIPSINFNELKLNINQYSIVSILEDEEHVDLFDDVERLPLSRFDIEKWNHNSGAIVFYCMSGKRSEHLVEAIKSKYSDAEVYSLLGGVNSTKTEVKA